MRNSAKQPNNMTLMFNNPNKSRGSWNYHESSMQMILLMTFTTPPVEVHYIQRGKIYHYTCILLYCRCAADGSVTARLIAGRNTETTGMQDENREL